MTGNVVLHHESLEKLGKGGVGVACKAEDLKLTSTCALRFLPADLTNAPASKEKSFHQVNAFSVLRHSNNCVVSATVIFSPSSLETDHPVSMGLRITESMKEETRWTTIRKCCSKL